MFRCGGPTADRQVDGDRLATEPLADFVERAEEVGPFAVHLVDEGDPRHAVLVGLVPDGFALGLDAFPGAEDHHGAVEHPQAPLHLGGEIGHGRGAFFQVEGKDDPVADPRAAWRRKAPSPQARPSFVARCPTGRPWGESNWKRPRTTFFSAAGTVITA